MIEKKGTQSKQYSKEVNNNKGSLQTKNAYSALKTDNSKYKSSNSSKLPMSQWPSRNPKPMVITPSSISKGRDEEASNNNIESSEKVTPINQTAVQSQQTQTQVIPIGVKNVADATSEFGGDIKNAWEDTWGKNAEERSLIDKIWHFAGLASGEATEFSLQLGTELAAGTTNLAFQGASQLVNEISPELAEDIRDFGQNSSQAMREGGYILADIGGDIVTSGIDTTKDTMDNMSSAASDSWLDVKSIWKDIWGKDAPDREFDDKMWDFAAKMAGEGTELLFQLGTEINIGATQFLTQGASRIADEYSPELAEDIRNYGDIVSDKIRETGYIVADIGGDIVDTGIDTIKETWENTQQAREDYGDDMREQLSNAWEDWCTGSRDGKKRDKLDIIIDLLGGAAGSTMTLKAKLKTDAASGIISFLSEGTGRIADEFSPEAGHNIRNGGDFIAKMTRLLGYTGAEIGGDVVHGALSGDSIADPNLSQSIGAIGVGFTPLGPIADIRDLITGFNSGDVPRAGLALIGAFPLLGEVGKYGDEITGGIKYLDDYAKLLGDSKELIKIAEEMPELADSLLKPAVIDAFADNSEALIKLAQNPDKLKKLLENVELLNQMIDDYKILELVLNNLDALDELVEYTGNLNELLETSEEPEVFLDYDSFRTANKGKYTFNGLIEAWNKYKLDNNIKTNDTSLREQFMGGTPSKTSKTGKEVIARMSGEGHIKIVNGEMEFYSQGAEKWFPLDQADMSHIKAAVTWWNEEGRKYGPKSKEVREFMLNSNNYYLEHYSINRSQGATLEGYLPPLE